MNYKILPTLLSLLILTACAAGPVVTDQDINTEKNNNSSQNPESSTTATNTSGSNTSNPAEISDASATKTYSMADVAQHADQRSCWMVIEGKVYDVTTFIDRHPGGERILQGCGVDATGLFEGTSPGGKVHSQFAKMMLKDYLIGELK